MIKRTFGILALTLAAACASGGNAAGSSPGKNPDVITEQELAAPELQSVDALQAVQRLRPRFLIARGMTSTASNSSAGGTHVSIDGGSLAALSDLQRMRPGALKEIRYLSPTEAAQRFGGMAANGAVLIVTSR